MVLRFEFPQTLGRPVCPKVIFETYKRGPVFYTETLLLISGTYLISWRNGVGTVLQSYLLLKTHLCSDRELS
jgi:hypothetical protein